MAVDIYIEGADLVFEQEADIYQPTELERKGEVDGKEFSITAKEKSLPSGTAATAASNLSAIVWDQAIFLSWDKSLGPVDSYVAIVKDSNGDEVVRAEGLEDTEIDFGNSNGVTLINGEQYELLVKTNSIDIVVTSGSVFGTPSDKTPQNLTRLPDEDGKVKLSWDTVSGDVLQYVAIIENDSGSVVKQLSVSNSEALLELPIGLLTLYVRSVSLKEYYESGDSNTLQIYNSGKIDDLSAIFDDANGEVDVSWSSVPVVDSYDLYYREQGGTFSIHTSGIVGTSKSIDDVSLGNGVFEFKVIPVKSGLDGAESNIDSVEVSILYIENSPDQSISTTVYDGSDIEFTDSPNQNLNTSTS